MPDYREMWLWADQHKAFAAWGRSVGKDIAEAFRVLARVQYDQPWLRIRR